VSEISLSVAKRQERNDNIGHDGWLATDLSYPACIAPVYIDLWTDRGSWRVPGQQTWAESEAESIDSSLPAGPCQSLHPAHRPSASTNSNSNTEFTRFIWWMQHAAPRGRRPLDQADQPEPIDPPIGSYSDYIHHRHLLLLSPKADTQFTIPQRVEGWVNLAGWLHTEMV